MDELYNEDEELAEEEEPEEDIPVNRGWAPAEGAGAETIHVETGRGHTAEVQVGAPFVETVERVAEEANYGGYFRVFLNGDELYADPYLDVARTQLNPSYPATIEPGMRIAVTSYDKVGAA